MRFRISGQGKKLFGDGIALWVTKESKFRTGNLFGRDPTFTGFAVILDTFRNTEAGHVHKDISILTSSGDYVMLDSERPGCDSSFRYDEGTDEFSATTSESAIKVHLKGSTVSVLVQRRPDESFEECFSTDLADHMEIVSGWKSEMYFAISATTGQLADNHDILEFTVAPPRNFEEWLSQEEDSELAPVVEIDISDSSATSNRKLAEQINLLADHVKELENELKELRHNTEHRDEAHGGGLTAALKKIQEQEKKLEERVNALEGTAKDAAKEAVDVEIHKAKAQVKGDMGSRMAKLESTLGRKVEEAANSTGGWKWPLMGMLVLFVAFAAYTNRSVTKLKNQDKLF